MLVVVGNLTWDRLIEVETLPVPNQDVLIKDVNLCPGGAAGNVAATVGALNHEVGLLACVGQDQEGEKLVKEISTYGVAASFIQYSEAHTSEFLAIMDEEGNRNFFLDPAEAAFQLSAKHLGHADLERISGLAFVGCRLDLARRVLRMVKRAETQVFANVGFWTASQELTESHVEFLLQIDCIFLNRQELDMLSEDLQDFLAGPRYLSGSNQLVVTAGKEETVVYRSVGETRVTPEPIEDIVNSLGCGDAFMGGYIAGYLSGLSPKRCCQSGHQCAARVARLICERS